MLYPLRVLGGQPKPMSFLQGRDPFVRSAQRLRTDHAIKPCQSLNFRLRSLSPTDEQWQTAINSEADPKKRDLLLAALFSVVRAECDAKKAQRDADVIERHLLTSRMLFAEGCLNIRGAYEYLEQAYMAKLGISPEMDRFKRWLLILKKDPNLQDCIRQHAQINDINKMASNLRDVYQKLFRHDPSFQGAPDAVDILVGIVDKQEAEVLKCVLECNSMRARIKYLLDSTVFASRLEEVKMEDEELGSMSD